MRALLDTHAFHWSVDAPDRLGRNARALLDDPQSALFVSAISGWELAQHAQRGKIRFRLPVMEWTSEALERAPIGVLPVSLPIAVGAELLAYPHRDPADRFILATALIHDLPVVTADARMQDWLGDLAIW